MRDCVLDERLQQKWRNSAIERVGCYFLAHAKSLTQKVCQLNTHVARSARVNTGERADRVQTVKEKVRIDLRLEGFQLRITRQDARLHFACLEFARSFH